VNEEDRATLQEWMERFEKTPGVYLDALKTPMRAAVLDDAKQAVCSDRNAEYGEPIDNFGRWAGACNSLGYRGPGGRDLKPHDLAVIMGLGKLSRSVQSPGKADTWVDLAGYAAVGYELVTLEDQ
jgi:hypothetical protein